MPDRTAAAPAIALRCADLACLAGLGLAWIAMAVLANPLGDFPLNDDWVYGLAVNSVLEHGEFRLPSPASANLFPQAYWGALFCLPFGFSFTALRMSTLTLGLVGIWSTYALLRELGTGRAIAFLASGLLAGNPVYFALACTFMTDVPFIAVAVAALFFLVRWAKHADTRDALVGLALAMLAILIRQAAIVIALGFAAGYLVKRGLSARTIAIAVGPSLLGILLHFGFQAWLHQTGRTPAVGDPPLLATVAENLSVGSLIPLRMFVFFAYAGLFSLPLSGIAAHRMWQRADAGERRNLAVAFAAALACALVAMARFGKPMPIVDNLLYGFGVGPLTLTDTYTLRAHLPEIPAWLAAFWRAATGAAMFSAALLAAMAAGALSDLLPRLRARAAAPATVVIATAGVAYLVLSALGLRNFYDRYVLFLLVVTVLLAGARTARDASGDRAGAAVALFALFVALEAAFTVVATRDYLEWNRVRWAASRALLASGVAQTSIDGGYEFNGWFGYDPGFRQTPGKSAWWVTDDEYLVAAGPMTGYSLLRTYPYRRLLTGEESAILILRRDPP